MSFSDEEIRFVREAVRLLEFPSFLVRVTDLIGTPVEKGVALLPAKARDAIQSTSRRAIDAALSVALSTLGSSTPKAGFQDAIRDSQSAGGKHRVAAGVSGFMGGMFGLPSLMAELPVTTTVMLRSIASIASAFGEDLEDRKVQLECLYLFSMGAPSSKDDEMESAYYTARIGLAQLVDKAVAFVAGRSAHEILKAVEKKSAPALIELLVRVAARFEIVVGEKAMGQLIPGIGAASGALLNVAFTEHFNSVAKYHFGLKRLEREKGKGQVEALYRQIHEELKRSG